LISNYPQKKYPWISLISQNRPSFQNTYIVSTPRKTNFQN
jgi:hypothetical protein